MAIRVLVEVPLTETVGLRGWWQRDFCRSAEFASGKIIAKTSKSIQVRLFSRFAVSRVGSVVTSCVRRNHQKALPLWRITNLTTIQRPRNKTSEMTRISRLAAMFWPLVFTPFLAISAASEAGRIQTLSHEGEPDLASMALDGEELVRLTHHPSLKSSS